MSSTSPSKAGPLSPQDRCGYSGGIGKLPGKRLERTLHDKQWKSTRFAEVGQALTEDYVKGPRILFVQSSNDRKSDLERLRIKSEDDDPESLQWFCTDDTCRDYMTSILHFPSYLFEESWYKSNGFAGSKRLSIDNAHVSWFRVLVKWVSGLNAQDYCWHEMTHFIHQSDRLGLTVIVFDVPEQQTYKLDSPPTQAHQFRVAQIRTGSITSTTKNPKADLFKPNVNPYHFADELCAKLERCHQNPATLDWKFMQAVLLKQSIDVVDRAVWACSKTVRYLEKHRPDPTIASSAAVWNFSSAHNLLRHSLHLTEILKVAVDTLNAWVISYEKAERGTLNIEYGELPADSHFDTLTQSLQILGNLQSRAASNEARLRNEIALAFNLVSQADTRAMRLISIITLLFLPATFVSTLFSMSFFGYQKPDERGDWGVTYKIWIYVAVAAPLTTLAVLMWFNGERLMAKVGGQARNMGGKRRQHPSYN